MTIGDSGTTGPGRPYAEAAVREAEKEVDCPVRPATDGQLLQPASSSSSGGQLCVHGGQWGGGCRVRQWWRQMSQVQRPPSKENGSLKVVKHLARSSNSISSTTSFLLFHFHSLMTLVSLALPWRLLNWDRKKFQTPFCHKSLQIHFMYGTIALSETLNPSEKTHALCLVNGECNENNIQSERWLVVPSTTFSIDQSQSTGFFEGIRGFWQGDE